MTSSNLAAQRHGCRWSSFMCHLFQQIPPAESPFVMRHDVLVLLSAEPVREMLVTS